MDELSQYRSVNGFGELTDGSCTQDARLNGVFRERRDENNWKMPILAAQCILQLHPVHVRHLTSAMTHDVSELRNSATDENV